ncbi:MAG: HAMP domain-containing protein [Myxococcota bacterium]
MFKSKYGLISAVIVIAFTIGAYMWSTSSVSTSINKIARKRLENSDSLMRRNEQENKMRSMALVSSASLEVGRDYEKYVQLKKQLDKEMEKQMELITKDGQIPAFLTVISKPRGRMKRSTIHWLAVNGQRVSSEFINGWINPRLIKKLLKKYPAKSKKTDSGKKDNSSKNTNEKEPEQNQNEEENSKKIKIPLIFPGESAGKYVSTPFEKKGYQVEDLKVVLGVHLVDRVQKQKDGSLTPVSNGILLAGFKGDSGVDKNLAAELLLRTGRQKSLFKLSKQISKIRKKLFEGLNAIYNGQKYNLQNRRPHLVAITDAQGNVVTRDRNDKNLSGYNYLNNKNSKLLLIQEAIKKKNVVYDIVEHEVINMFNPKKRPSEIYQVASIPFFDNQGKVSGTVNIAWPFDVRVSQINMVSRIKFSFFYKNSAFYTNFQGTNAINEFEKAFKGRFEAADISPLCKKDKSSGEKEENKTDKKAEAKGQDIEKNINVEKFDFAGENYLGAYYRFRNLTLNETKYGYIIMVSLEDMHKPFKGTGLLIIVFGIIAFILVFLVEYLVFNYFYSKIDALDEGIQEIAAGDLEFVFGRISPEMEGVANSLNEMLNVLVGREAMDEETGETPEKEGINLLYMGPKPEMPYLEDDEIIASYVNIDYNDYWDQLYSKFKEIWKKSGRKEPVPSQDLFEQRIKLYERMVLHQFECEMVFFDIKLKENGIEVVPLPLT